MSKLKNKVITHNDIKVSVVPHTFFCEYAKEIDAFVGGLAKKVEQLASLPTNTPEQARLLGLFQETVKPPEYDQWVNNFVEAFNPEERNTLLNLLFINNLSDAFYLYSFILHLLDNISMSLDEYELQSTRLVPFKENIFISPEELGQVDDRKRIQLEHVVCGHWFSGQYRAY